MEIVANYRKIRGFVLNFLPYRDLLKQLVLRDIKLKYRRSYLGYLWSILHPLMLMTVLVIIFSNIFRFDIPNFPLYLITGQVAFSFMSEATNSGLNSITANASLLKKVYVPKYIFTLARVLSSLVNFLFSFGALILVFIFTNAHFSLEFFFIPVIISELLIFSLGLGMFLAAATVFFRDIHYLWGVCLSMWMYLTPLFYPVSIIPEKYQWAYKNLNPMFRYIEQLRDIILENKLPTFSSVILGFLIAFLFCFLGFWYFKKTQDNFILYI